MNAPAHAVTPRATLQVTIGQHSDRGRKALNQDFHGACLPGPAQRIAKGITLALADGIGSSDVSQVASEAAVRSALEDYYCTSQAWSVKRSMQQVLAATNAWLHAQTRRSPYRDNLDRGYVCAFSALVLKGRTAHVFHAGDTRIARLQGRTIEQLTQDHHVKPADGHTYLGRALGFRSLLEMDYRALPIEVGDVYVMTSDGVHDTLAPTHLASLVREHETDLDGAARAIVEAALALGSCDNLSVQIVRVDALPEHDGAELLHACQALPLPPVLAPRELFDGHRIERVLHASHRSHVYLATDLASDARVVLKTPSTELGQDGPALDRFLLEEWIARRVHSAHVLQPRAVERPRSHLYVAFEYVQGRTLAQWMRDEPQPALESVRGVIEQIARGLQAFHRMEMVHQDLRPENVMIDEHGSVKIIDFGSTRVAGLVEGNDRSTPAALLGTLGYTAPELFLGDAGSERSDQFSLGVLAYQLLTGRLPYGTRVPGVRSRADQSGLRYHSARDAHGRIPAWVDAALQKAVHPLPHKRYDALSEFVHDLHHPNPAWLARTRTPLIERNPLLMWKALCVVLALALVGLLGAWPVRAASPPAQKAVVERVPAKTGPVAAQRTHSPVFDRTRLAATT